MSYPASARVISLNKIDSSNVGEKIRTYGFLKLPEDRSSAIMFLASSRRNKDGCNRGLLVDVSICLDPLSSESFVFREQNSLVMVMGSLEELQVAESMYTPIYLLTPIRLMNALILVKKSPRKD
jgi:hypothetical protein